MERLTLAYASSPLLFWLAGSVVVYALATNLAWLLQPTNMKERQYGRAFVQILQFLFFLGIPYLVLGGWPRRPFQGLFSLEDLGVVGLSSRWPATRWLGTAGTTFGLGLLASLILIFAWAHAKRAGGGSWLRFPPRPWWSIVVDAIYLQVHWAFYRTALAVTLDDWYPAIFLGLGLIYLEWGLNPFWRQAWRSEACAATTWLRAAVALVAALLYLLTRNLWACLAVHLLMELVFRRLSPVLNAAQTAH